MKGWLIWASLAVTGMLLAMRQLPDIAWLIFWLTALVQYFVFTTSLGHTVRAKELVKTK